MYCRWRSNDQERELGSHSPGNLPPPHTQVCVLKCVNCFYVEHRLKSSSVMFNYVHASYINTLIPPHSCVCLKLGHGFPTSYFVVFFCIQRVKVIGNIVRFVDIDVILCHHCFNFIFIPSTTKKHCRDKPVNGYQTYYNEILHITNQSKRAISFFPLINSTHI
jgi:hypothetical protein